MIFVSVCAAVAAVVAAVVLPRHQMEALQRGESALFEGDLYTPADLPRLMQDPEYWATQAPQTSALGESLAEVTALKDQLQEDLDETRGWLTAARKERDDARTGVTDLEAKLKSAEAARGQAVTDLEAARKTNDDLGEKLKAAEAARDQAVTDFETARAANAPSDREKMLSDLVATLAPKDAASLQRSFSVEQLAAIARAEGLDPGNLTKGPLIDLLTQQAQPSPGA